MLWLFISSILLMPCLIWPYINQNAPLTLNYQSSNTIVYLNTQRSSSYLFPALDQLKNRCNNSLVNNSHVILPYTKTTSPPFNKIVSLTRVPELFALFNFNHSAISQPSDTILLANYFSQSIGLLSFFFPLYFYDPRESTDNFNYLLSSTLLSLGFFPTAIATNSTLFRKTSFSSGQIPFIYLYGFLGTATGFLLPLLTNSSMSVQKQLYTSKPLTGALTGYITGTLFAVSFYGNSQLSNLQSALICSISITGMIAGVALPQLFHSTSEKTILKGILIGGWSGLFAGSALEKFIRYKFPFTTNPPISIQFSLPAMTSIPVIVSMKYFPKLNDTHFSLVDLKVLF